MFLKRTERRKRNLRLSGSHLVNQSIGPLQDCQQSLILEIGKAANVGGSVVSGLEMAQNSQRASWSAKKVDDQLIEIMESIFKLGIDTAREYVELAEAEGELPSLLAGSNIAGFCKVAAAMRAQGDWW